jgi:serpin B
MASLYNGDGAKLNIANSIWFRDSASLRLKDEFIAVNKDLLGADVYKRAFDSTTVKELNAYVSDKTDGMIKELMQEIDPDMMVFLINALVFDAEWNEMFVDSAVREGTFTSSDGVIRAVEMMSSEEYNYLRDEKAEGFIKHYAFGYSFVAMVPDVGVELDDYISSLDYESLYGLIKSSSYRLVDAKMPKFKYEYSVDMKDTLKEMDVTVPKQKPGLKGIYDRRQHRHPGLHPQCSQLRA